MVIGDKSTCPSCGGQLKHYDTVGRVVRTKGGRMERIKIRRFRCAQCGAFHRQIPNGLLPFKQYEAEVVYGVLEGLITPDTIGFEDYPCEMTMLRWLSQKAQLLLWRNPYAKGEKNHEIDTCGIYSSKAGQTQTARTDSGICGR